MALKLADIPVRDGDVRELVDAVWREAAVAGASDVHVEPVQGGYEVRFRVDGMLETRAGLAAEVGRGVVGRMMVLAKLLTYRLDVPQEGRATVGAGGRREMEVRVSVMPTVQGLRAAVRLPADVAGIGTRGIEELGFDRVVVEGLKRYARGDGGMLIVTGPAGSGKTTTIYALLAYLAEQAKGMSIVSLEDPVERLVAGVTQIEVRPFGELTYEKALRSMLRQDPQVLMLGEIRDSATAQLAVQAAMTGHRLITTLHAPSAAGAIGRLLEIGIEPYQITNALWGVVGQRLLRKREGEGYRGRVGVAEIVEMEEGLRRVVLEKGDGKRMEEALRGQVGYRPMREAGQELVRRGVTDEPEWTRVFGG